MKKKNKKKTCAGSWLSAQKKKAVWSVQITVKYVLFASHERPHHPGNAWNHFLLRQNRQGFLFMVVSQSKKLKPICRESNEKTPHYHSEDSNSQILG